MGIPSYYKKLIDTIPGLVSKGHPDADIQWLFMDFNCLIYHCLHREDTPPYPGDSNKDEWETQFTDCIVKYCLKVIKEVNPKKGVFIAIDGVVPMAKMRQQRLRRFKSIWLAQHPESDTPSGPTWDRNSITPGTLFMKKLRTRLETMISKHGKKSWILSSSDEPGEGEHKLLSEWRKGTYSGNYAVYGLDADLIILSILGHECCNLNNKVWLFREEVTGGKISYDDLGEEVFEWFSINSLKDWLSAEFNSDKEKQKSFVLNYCFAMSVLGNDFLPSSLGLKIRDDGHSELLDIIKSLTSNNIKLVDLDNYQLSLFGIKELFRILSNDEPVRISKYIHKKQMIANNLGENADGTHLKLGDNNWPLSKIEEIILIESKKQLHPKWQERYLTSFFSGFSYTKNNVDKICKEYLYGIQWIWAYYTGNMTDVCFNWFYPYNLPPTWQWIYNYLNKNELPSFPDRVLVKATDIKPVEQLSLVLPLESWGLIPPCPERSLPNLAPQFYPSSFSFESVGKRYFWECESMIPLPSILEIKEIIRNYT
jgi:5'-3' exoribonuclease 4